MTLRHVSISPRRMLLAVLMLALLALPGCKPAPLATCPGLKVGMLFTSENEAAKKELDAGYQEAIREVNLKGLNGCKVEMVLPRSEKTANVDVARDVQDLVDQGALVILSAQTNEASKRMAKVASYLQAPMIVTVDTGDEIVEATDTPWFVRINPSNASYPLAVSAYLGTVEMVQAPRVAIMFEQSEYGESSAAAAGRQFLKDGISIGLYYRFSTFLTDFKEASGLIAKSDPPINIIYMISSRADQAQLLIKQMTDVRTTLGATLSFDALVGVGNGFSSRDFLTTPSLPGNLVVAAPWVSEYAWPEAAQCAGAPAPAASLGTIETPVVRNAQGYAGMRLALNAIEQVTQKKSWVISEKKTVTDWKEMLRTAEYVPLFRADVAAALRAQKTCQLGAQLWPLSIDASGQNQRQALLAHIQEGKLAVITAAP